MFPLSHKTVVVLDHTPYFGISSESRVELELSRGLRQPPLQPGQSPHQPPHPPQLVTKSLWTCSVEAAIEYCRIVWDLFPQGKLVRFVVSDTAAHILNTWNPTQQNLTHILNALCLMGIPGSNTNVTSGPSVVPGLRAAVEALAEPSPQQQNRIHRDLHILNRCRIVCITSARDNTSIQSLIDIVHTVILQQNKILHPHMLRIHHCHLVIINIYPVNVESMVSSQQYREVCSSFSVEVHTVSAGRLTSRLLRLLMPHYNLASTTVTGIPMKEEQNASSSANYDVEILHSTSAHADLGKGSSASGEKTGESEVDYETVTLRWCTPRGSWGEWGACGPLHRVTPVDVASRPSACLVNFLLNGRTVMLEMPRKGGGKVMSHVLAAHGGEIFIYGLSAGRSALEDPPSVSEGAGGRVTDYRIKDFGEVMQLNRLGPLKGPGALLRAKTRLSRHTLCWPLTLSSTLLFNLGSHVDPLPRLMVKETLTEEDVVQCKQVVYSLVGLEARHEPLVLPNLGHSKGPRREEHWRQVWGELEALVRGHQGSPGHRAVLHCLRECRTSDSGNTSGSSNDSSVRASVIRATTDSPMSPPASGMSATVPPIHQPSPVHSSIYNTPRSVLDMFLGGDSNRSGMRRLEFAGRMANPNGIATLYPVTQSQWSNMPESTPLETG
ncbi:integrator complex subunit 13 asun isoform X2 [Arctopsyche grandis]|uniref:integrator complex subunit 13 asun isoform X2 n=1 Tax=Arctopsyche grandis TaxID=121162 RepID=UPI00406D6DA4